jgi:hypothetical protein
MGSELRCARILESAAACGFATSGLFELSRAGPRGVDYGASMTKLTSLSHTGHQCAKTDATSATARHAGHTNRPGPPDPVIADVGPVEIEVPRDRAGTFDPQIVKKRQRRLSGVDEMVLSLSARG